MADNRRIEYQIVGRYMDGTEVTGYQLMSMDTGKTAIYNKEQVAFLVGKGQITNCEGQIYQDKFLLRGKGMKISELPVYQKSGALTKTDSLGKIRRGTSAEDAMTQVTISAVVTDGRNVVGYVVKNSAGATKVIDRMQLLTEAKAGRIGNARVQMYNGKPILKGVNCDLKQLPKIKSEELKV